MLTSEDTANIRNMLQDPDAGGDVLFWLYATVAYAVLRVTTEVLFPGKIGKFTTQRIPRRLEPQPSRLKIDLPLTRASHFFGQSS